MSCTRLSCVSLVGLETLPIEVEVDVNKSDKLSLVIVGLPDTAIREAKDRVLTAIKNSRFCLDAIHCTVNLAPGDLKKEGVFYDLPIALGILKASGHLPHIEHLADYLIVGELALSGELRPIHGALAIALLARKQGKKGLILPNLNAQEAALVKGLAVYGMKDLKETVAFMQDPSSFSSIQALENLNLLDSVDRQVDFLDIKGQKHVKRALEIAAAGGHNIVLSGPPGCGKTLMAKALIGIMPALTTEESLEVTKIHSIAGLLPTSKQLMRERPFRSPHHTISYAGLIGGGSYPRPGEVSLAHQGILFLDEFPEFSRAVLEVLRQPLEDRQVTISRAHGHLTFPTNFICVAAMNPCPCGFLGHPDKVCKDSRSQIERYRNKISGPLWDRLDIHVDVPALRYQDMANTEIAESSAQIRERVEQVRQKQIARFQQIKTNAQMNRSDLKSYCSLTKPEEEIIQLAMDQMGFSARACDRLLRVARTIADLDCPEDSIALQPKHLLEALNLKAPT